MPIFVGLVRGATTAAGCSWKLSGGSQFSWAVTNVSKYRHVRRDSLDKNARCSSDNCAGAAVNDRLSHHAIPGDTSHSPSSGPAIGKIPGRHTASNTITPAPINGAIHMTSKNPHRSVRRCLRGAGGFPFQQLLLGPMHPYQRPRDGVQVGVCVIWNKDEREQKQRRLLRQCGKCDS